MEKSYYVYSTYYVHYFLKSSLGRKEIESRASGNQLSMRNLSQKKFLDITIPIPPQNEQKEIVRRVTQLLQLTDKLEARYLKAKQSIDKLTQSILAKALRGELVPTEVELARQESRSYETAEALLVRIKAEREPAKSKRTKKKQKT